MSSQRSNPGLFLLTVRSLHLAQGGENIHYSCYHPAVCVRMCVRVWRISEVEGLMGSDRRITRACYKRQTESRMLRLCCSGGCHFTSWPLLFAWCWRQTVRIRCAHVRACYVSSQTNGNIFAKCKQTLKCRPNKPTLWGRDTVIHIEKVLSIEKGFVYTWCAKPFEVDKTLISDLRLGIWVAVNMSRLNVHMDGLPLTTPHFNILE